VYGTDDDECMPKLEEEQLAAMVPMSEVTVLLSAMIWKVLFDVLELKVACASAPPVREEFVGSPYCVITCQ
jgi:hypothetical protein